MLSASTSFHDDLVKPSLTCILLVTQTNVVRFTSRRWRRLQTLRYMGHWGGSFAPWGGTRPESGKRHIGPFFSYGGRGATWSLEWILSGPPFLGIKHGQIPS